MASGVIDMRVISGQARGRKLLAPEGFDTRPTTDRVKESMFNLIMSYLPGENILDLFAGSGALGIEALSRGSKHGVFVEADRQAANIVRKNLELARQTHKADIFEIDAFSYLSRCDCVFDIIFLDPPYNKGMLNKALDIISNRKLLASGGIIVAEGEFGGEVPNAVGFDIVKAAKYGKTNVFGFFMGQANRALKGKATPMSVKAYLEEKFKNV